jgi:hypothetical protein
MQTMFTFFYKTSNLNEEVNRTEPFPSVSVPWLMNPTFVFVFRRKTSSVIDKTVLDNCFVLDIVVCPACVASADSRTTNSVLQVIKTVLA